VLAVAAGGAIAPDQAVNLQRRVEKLEAAVGRTRDDILVIRFIVPGNGTSGGPRPTEVRRIRCGDQEWHRLEGETLEAFIERAKVEAQERRSGGVRVFIGDPSDEGPRQRPSFTLRLSISRALTSSSPNCAFARPA